MPDVHIDFPEVQVAASIGTTDTDDTPWADGVFVIPVCIPLERGGRMARGLRPVELDQPRRGDRADHRARGPRRPQACSGGALTWTT